MQKKQAIILASFGTANTEARKATLDVLAEETASAYPEFRVMQAYTSNFVRRRMAADGFRAFSPAECLDELAQAGFRRVVVQPTHLSPGEEYENKLIPMKSRFAACFGEFLLGEPVFFRKDDYGPGLEIVAGCFPLCSGEQLVLLGHGSPHRHNPVYEGLQQIADEKGLPIHIGLVEESDLPDFSMVRERLIKRGADHILLAPLLLTGGTHVTEDMAGEGSHSWKKRLEALGITVRVSMKSLGAFPEFRQLYLDKIRQLLRMDNQKA